MKHGTEDDGFVSCTAFTSSDAGALWSWRTLTICQIRPSTRWGVPALMSSASMLTTLQPMARAELSIRVMFSEISTGCLAFLLMARSSMVSGTASLMSLQSTRPFLHASNRPPSPWMGNRFLSSASSPSEWLIQSVKAMLSSSEYECAVPAADAVDVPPMTLTFCAFCTMVPKPLAELLPARIWPRT